MASTLLFKPELHFALLLGAPVAMVRLAVAMVPIAQSATAVMAPTLCFIAALPLTGAQHEQFNAWLICNNGDESRCRGAALATDRGCRDAQ